MNDQHNAPACPMPTYQELMRLRRITAISCALMCGSALLLSDGDSGPDSKCFAAALQAAADEAQEAAAPLRTLLHWALLNGEPGTGTTEGAR